MLLNENNYVYIMRFFNIYFKVGLIKAKLGGLHKSSLSKINSGHSYAIVCLTADQLGTLGWWVLLRF